MLIKSNLSSGNPPNNISETVRFALEEDVGSGDVTGLLLPEEQICTATVITRENAVICGQDWFNEVFTQTDSAVTLEWMVEEGSRCSAGTVLVSLRGPSRSLLQGERVALNFLQTLSGTATATRKLVNLVEDLSVKILDTRKTLPGLRLAQKYAVACGGGFNHRLGLYDAYLIKENHIISTGGISEAVARARALNPAKPVEIEVENLSELQQALEAKADIIMLDELSLEDMKTAVELTAGRAKLEASGNVSENNLREIAKTGVDYISVGAITKHCRAIDLSMRLL